MTSYVGYNNIIDQASSYPASDESADYPFANSFNWNLYDVWKPSVSGSAYGYFTMAASTAADYVAIYGHNLDGVIVHVEVQSGTWVTAHSFAVSGDNCVFERFNSLSGTAWRVRLEGVSGSSEIACMAVGQALELNPLRQAFAPPPKARNKEIVNNHSVDYVPLGRVVRTVPYDIKVPQTLVSTDWIDANFENLANHINEKPFFFTWDDTREDAVICWTTDAVNSPIKTSPRYWNFTIKAKGLR